LAPLFCFARNSAMVSIGSIPAFSARANGIESSASAYRNKVMCNTQMVRIAIHPKDHEHALSDQKEMIQGLKDVNYTFLRYEDVERLFG
jgi:hypothetical protein